MILRYLHFYILKISVPKSSMEKFRYRILFIGRPSIIQLSSSRAPVLEALCIRQLALAEGWLVVSIDVSCPRQVKVQ